MNKIKLLQNQRRQARRGAYERMRTKKWLFFKHTRQLLQYYNRRIKRERILLNPITSKSLKWYHRLWNFIKHLIKGRLK